MKEPSAGPLAADRRPGVADSNGLAAADATQLTAAELEAKLGCQMYLVIHFSAPACEVCHVTWPRVKALADTWRWSVMDIPIDIQPAVAAQRLVFTVPTVLVLLDGRELQRESRFIDFPRLERMLALAGPLANALASSDENEG